MDKRIDLAFDVPVAAMIAPPCPADELLKTMSPSRSAGSAEAA